VVELGECDDLSGFVDELKLAKVKAADIRNELEPLGDEEEFSRVEQLLERAPLNSWKATSAAVKATAPTQLYL